MIREIISGWDLLKSLQITADSLKPEINHCVSIKQDLLVHEIGTAAKHKSYKSKMSENIKTTVPAIVAGLINYII